MPPAFRHQPYSEIRRHARDLPGDMKRALGSQNDAFFGAHRLWLAQYGSLPKPQVSWSTFWLWQYTDGQDGPVPRTVPGIPGNAKGELDCNHYAGTDAQLAQEWAGS